MKTGFNNNYHWVVSESPILYLHDIVVNYHVGQILHVTSFDSGPLRLTEEEKRCGWIQKSAVAISPPLVSGFTVPYDNNDEWYVSSTKLEFPDDFKAFVNYGAFTLETPQDLTKFDDPTWERGRCDFLYPLQEEFWGLLALIKPKTYIAQGQKDIVVSKDAELINVLSGRA